MDTYNINGVAVEYDTFDTVNMELFISELERVQKETEALPKDVAAYMKGMCELVRDFFDTLIGEGTSDKCFGPRSNLKTIVFAYGDFAAVWRKRWFPSRISRTGFLCPVLPPPPPTGSRDAQRNGHDAAQKLPSG